VALESHGGAASGVVFERTREEGGTLVGAGGAFRIEADVVFAAIGQKGAFDAAGVKRSRDGRIEVDAERRTSLAGVWAGGDCVAGGLDLTVAAVEDGKQAARSIDAALKSKG
jgi:glutamate synthase (NADPH/NADH) small chain